MESLHRRYARLQCRVPGDRGIVPNRRYRRRTIRRNPWQRWTKPSSHLGAELDEQIRTARRRETLLWALSVLAFALTLATGSIGIVLVFLASLKLGIASGAAGLFPGCTGTWLKWECATRSRNRRAIERRRDEEFRLRQAAATIADFPPGREKENFTHPQIASCSLASRWRGCHSCFCLGGLTSVIWSAGMQPG
jgi:hypothetical protein